ncbi:hypothetical protein BDQ17DRAFT_1538068 [Cyathus striatus]|nr:hypothetical protein BDQ17DRAFT_1538068 [Cyathus striatus]
MRQIFIDAIDVKCLGPGGRWNWLQGIPKQMDYLHLTVLSIKHLHIRGMDDGDLAWKIFKPLFPNLTAVTCGDLGEHPSHSSESYTFGMTTMQYCMYVLGIDFYEGSQLHALADGVCIIVQHPEVNGNIVLGYLLVLWLYYETVDKDFYGWPLDAEDCIIQVLFEEPGLLFVANLIRRYLNRGVGWLQLPQNNEQVRQ